jgi:ribosomal protein S27AE
MTIPPLPAVLASISITIELLSLMSTDLLSSEVDIDIQIEEDNHDDDQTLKNMEQETECPRCSDIMILSSDFDKLGYICQKCDLILVLK